MTTNSSPCKVLMVDDEPSILAACRRTVGRVFPMMFADSAAAGLKAIASAGPFAVILTDMRMPVMNGLEFIAIARQLARESVFMMLTGNADQQTAIDAINRGKIFRFLSKPCPQEQLEQSIRAGISQYELVTAERTLLRDTVTGSIKLMVDALELSNPGVFAYQSLIKSTFTELATHLGLNRDWQLNLAATICLIGLVTIPGVKGDEAISNESLSHSATIGSRLLGHVPRMAGVAAIVRRQCQRISLPASFDHLAQEELEVVGSQLLRFSFDLAREERKLGGRSQAIEKLRTSYEHDARLLHAMAGEPKPMEMAADNSASTPGQVAAALTAAGNVPAPIATIEMSIADLQPDMTVAHDVCREDGVLMLSKGQTLSDLAVESLRYCARQGSVAKKILVFAPPPAAVPVPAPTEPSNPTTAAA